MRATCPICLSLLGFITITILVCLQWRVPFMKFHILQLSFLLVPLPYIQTSSATCSQPSRILLIILMWQIETLKQFISPRACSLRVQMSSSRWTHAWSQGTIWKMRRWQSRRLLHAGRAWWHHPYGILHCCQTRFNAQVAKSGHATHLIPQEKNITVSIKKVTVPIK
jgi:hypothetical protein